MLLVSKALTGLYVKLGIMRRYGSAESRSSAVTLATEVRAQVAVMLRERSEGRLTACGVSCALDVTSNKEIINEKRGWSCPKCNWSINQMQHRGEGNKSARETGVSDLNLSLLTSNRPYFTFHFNPLSSVRNSPRCSFGSAARSLQVKKFTNHENLQYDCKGRDNEGGPKYNPTDKFSYTQRLGARFSKAQRFAPTLSYEHYFRNDKEININQADLSRRSKSPRAIGTLAHRFPDQKQYKQTPGPQYLVTDNPRFARKPRYSLYARRFLEHTNPLLKKVSTPRQIGPGSYYVQKCAKDSTDINKPAFTIGNEKRVLFKQRKQSINQTYDCTPSMGMQPRSGQQRFPGYSIGRRDRDMREGIFESHMDRIPKKERFSKPKV